MDSPLNNYEQYVRVQEMLYKKEYPTIWYEVGIRSIGATCGYLICSSIWETNYSFVAYWWCLLSAACGWTRPKPTIVGGVIFACGYKLFQKYLTH